MELNGIKANKDFIDDFGVQLKDKIKLLELEIYEYAGYEFNINSTVQLGEVLFEKLKLPPGKKTDSKDRGRRVRPVRRGWGPG